MFDNITRFADYSRLALVHASSHSSGLEMRPQGSRCGGGVVGTRGEGVRKITFLVLKILNLQKTKIMFL